jgi:lipopolysaccharide export system permease protein
MSAFVMVFVLGDFIEKVDDYIEHKAAFFDVVRYILYQLPNIAFMVMPVAVMLSTLLSLGMLSKNSEIIAMKASGIPLYRIALPIFTAAFALCGIIFLANETVIPYCNAKADYIRHVKIEKKMVRPALKHNRLWFRGPRGEIINVGLIEFKGKVPTCYGVTFYRLDETFRLVGRVDAERMEWVNERWLLSKGTVYDFPASGPVSSREFDRQFVDLPEKPEDFRQVERLSEEMNISELRSYITRLKNEGYNPTNMSGDPTKIAFTGKPYNGDCSVAVLAEDVKERGDGPGCGHLHNTFDKLLVHLLFFHIARPRGPLPTDVCRLAGQLPVLRDRGIPAPTDR